MRIGQTSLVHFLSELVASVVGFVATIYFARILGAEVLGIYFLVVAIVSWLKVTGQMGVTSALTKRISEGEAESEFATAGILLIAAAFSVTSLAVVLARGYLESYIGYPAVPYLLFLLLTSLLLTYVHAVLRGEHLVHISAVLSPLETFGQSVIQIFLVATAFGVVGLFVGQAIGTAIAILVGVVMITSSLSTPDREHFEEIVSFAKYSWLGAIRGRVFNWIDIIILGFFVSNALVGIYSVAWRLVSFLMIFSLSISTALFPDMSNLSTKGDMEAIRGRLEDALGFTGLFLIPGLIGGTVLGSEILSIYGPEFQEGTVILSILIAAGLVHGYQHQLLNTLNAIDRPESAFRVNSVFIVLNVVLNIVLVYAYGWVGAAVATLVSIAVSAALGYYALSQYLRIRVPNTTIAAQWVAGAVMGAAILGIRSTLGLPDDAWVREAAIVALVLVGAGVYFVVLLAVSSKFRNVLRANIPKID